MPFLMAPTAYMFNTASRGNTKISKNPVASSANSYGAFLGMVISMQDNFQRYFDQALNLLCKNEMSQAEKNLSVGLITTKANVMFSLAEITNSWQKLPVRESLANFGNELQQLLEALNSLVEWLEKEMEKVFDAPSTISMYVYAQLLATTLGNVNKFLNFFRVELQDRYIKDTQLDMFKLLTVTEHLMADFSRRIPAINLMLKNEKNEEEEKTEFYRMKEAVERLDGECKRLYKQNEGLSQQLQKTQYKLEKANDKILIGKGTVRAAKQTIAQSNLQKSQLIVLTEELQQKNEEIAKLNIQLVDGMM